MRKEEEEDEGRKEGRKKGREDGDLTRRPSRSKRRPNDGCQRCTQVKLKWLQRDGKEAPLWTGRIHNAGEIFTGMAALVQATRWLRSCPIKKQMFEKLLYWDSLKPFSQFIVI